MQTQSENERSLVKRAGNFVRSIVPGKPENPKPTSQDDSAKKQESSSKSPSLLLTVLKTAVSFVFGRGALAIQNLAKNVANTLHKAQETTQNQNKPAITNPSTKGSSDSKTKQSSANKEAATQSGQQHRPVQHQPRPQNTGSSVVEDHLAKIGEKMKDLNDSRKRFAQKKQLNSAGQSGEQGAGQGQQGAAQANDKQQNRHPKKNMTSKEIENGQFKALCSYAAQHANEHGLVPELTKPILGSPSLTLTAKDNKKVKITPRNGYMECDLRGVGHKGILSLTGLLATAGEKFEKAGHPLNLHLVTDKEDKQGSLQWLNSRLKDSGVNLVHPSLQNVGISLSDQKKMRLTR
jgi:hypothetical protein